MHINFCRFILLSEPFMLNDFIASKIAPCYAFNKNVKKYRGKITVNDKMHSFTFKYTVKFFMYSLN